MDRRDESVSRSPRRVGPEYTNWLARRVIRPKEVRTNDGAADPWGRFWIGSMAFNAEVGRGTLYRFHESTGTETMFGDVTISNGIGWSPDARTMYYIDTGPGYDQCL